MNIVMCVACGIHDDAPKVHVFEGGAFHFQHLPDSLRAQVVQNADAKAIVQAAESGIHGQALRDFIQTLHGPNGGGNNNGKNP